MSVIVHRLFRTAAKKLNHAAKQSLLATSVAKKGDHHNFPAVEKETFFEELFPFFALLSCFQAASPSPLKTINFRLGYMANPLGENIFFESKALFSIEEGGENPCGYIIPLKKSRIFCGEALFSKRAFLLLLFTRSFAVLAFPKIRRASPLLS